ncbi:MAG: hypothetical protein IJQ95_06505 [Paludibacteraceae bacterium]|nr:hypothetical protein [Paludibacteraceae bacterium]
MNTEQLHRLRYRYPGLDEADLLIEASWQELEHKAERKPKCLARRRIVDKFTKPMLARMDEPCMLEQAVGARAFSAELEPVSLEMDYDFEAERQRMMDEIRERLERLRELGVDELILRKLLEKEDTLSRLVVTRDYRILLPDYHNMEIEMTPLPKAVFLLFLKHEEGIPFKFLSDYEDELRDIYMRLTDRVQTDVIDKSIQALCDPTQNAINEKCTRIREAFVAKFDERLAQHYFVTGKRGEPKRIQLQRSLVVWE